MNLPGSIACLAIYMCLTICLQTWVTWVHCLIMGTASSCCAERTGFKTNCWTNFGHWVPLFNELLWHWLGSMSTWHFVQGPYSSTNIFDANLEHRACGTRYALPFNESLCANLGDWVCHYICASPMKKIIWNSSCAQESRPVLSTEFTAALLHGAVCTVWSER